MYFRNISNEEFQYFHGIKASNFSISLTDILHKTGNKFDNKLFKIEEIIEDTLYRIYPLFYTNEIVSTNNADRIIDNKCIIATKRDAETYYKFIKDDGVIPIYLDVGQDTFTIGDKLTEDEFNALVYILKRFNPFTDNININNSIITTDYAKYIFNLEEATIIDNGILITKETLESIGTVRLVSPVFKHSTYILHLKVYSVDNVNIDIASQDNIEVTNLDIPLVENTDVNIPFDTLDLNNIIGFEATVTITHDKPVIQYFTSLDCSVSDYSFVGESVDLSCVVKTNNVPVEDATVTFYDGNDNIGTATSDSNGIATLTYTPESAKEYQIHAKYDGINSNTVSMVIDKIPTSITLSSTKNIAYIPTTFTLTGVLKRNGKVFANQSIKLYNNGVLLDDTLTTDSNGVFTKTISANNVTSYNIQAVYEGDPISHTCSSEYVSVTARKLNNTLTISTDKTTVYYSQTVTISGVLTDELGNKVSNVTVKLYNGSTLITSTTTNNNGGYSFTRTWSQGNYQFKVVYDGDSSHNSVTSANKSVSMNKAPTSINNLSETRYDIGDTIPIKVVSSYGTFNPSSITVKVYDAADEYHTKVKGTFTVSEKDSNGNFRFIAPRYTNGYYDLVISYAGDSNYTSSSRTVKIYIVEADVGSITLSRTGQTFIAKFKDSNNNVLANTTLTSVWFNFKIDQSNRTMEIQTAVTDSSGNITIVTSIYGTCTLYVKYGDVTSNTISFTI